MTAVEHSPVNRAGEGDQSQASPRTDARLDREKARVVVSDALMEAYDNGTSPNAFREADYVLDALDALEACVVPDPPQTIDRDALIRIAVGCMNRELGPENAADEILRLAQPATGVALAPEEARRAAGWWDMADGKYGVTQPDLDLVRKLEASA